MRQIHICMILAVAFMGFICTSQFANSAGTLSERVENTVVKKVRKSRIGGTWRYFFRIENPSEYEDSVEIDIKYSCPALKNLRFRTLTIELSGGLHTVFYVDHSVAPYHLGDHAEYGIQEFMITVSKEGESIYVCRVPVADEYEDASGDQ